MIRISFIDPSGTVRVAEAEAGTSVMRAATEADIPGIIGECGGSMTCGTCHVRIDEAWAEHLGSPDEDEAVILEFTEGAGENSRLSCQIAISEKLDGLVVHVPEALEY